MRDLGVRGLAQTECVGRAEKPPVSETATRTRSSCGARSESVVRSTGRSPRRGPWAEARESFRGMASWASSGISLRLFRSGTDLGASTGTCGQETVRRPWLAGGQMTALAAVILVMYSACWRAWACAFSREAWCRGSRCLSGSMVSA